MDFLHFINVAGNLVHCFYGHYKKDREIGEEIKGIFKPLRGRGRRRVPDQRLNKEEQHRLAPYHQGDNVLHFLRQSEQRAPSAGEGISVSAGWV